MKGYVVTLMNLPASVEVATRCIESAKQFDVDVTMFPAVDKMSVMEELKDEGLRIADFDTSYSDVKAVLSNFLTQFRIWKHIASTEPGIVLEHDAVFVGPIPSQLGNITNLGKPSYGKYNTPPSPGIYKMFSKSGGYIPGAHGYYVTCEGAAQLCNIALHNGASPCDMFLCLDNFDINEVYPWPIEAHDSFTTIQQIKGCKAKHNYNTKYQILTNGTN